MTSIVQDNYGFLWIATQDGLNRFDGTNFKKIDAYFTDETKEKYSRLGKIFIDQKSRVWAITSDGNINRAEGEDLIPITQINNASAIVQKSEGQFLIGSYTEGMFMLTEGDDIKLVQLIDDVGIYNIIKDGQGYLLATDRGVMYLDQTTQSIQSLYPELSAYHISDIQRLQTGSLIISTYADGVFIGDGAKVERYPGLPEGLRVQDLLLAKDQSIWVATYSNGLYRMRNKIITHYSSSSSSIGTINYNDVICIYEDHHNNIWIGTDGGGLSVYNRKQKPINSITNNEMPIGMSVDVPRAISTDQDGNIWVGTSGKGLTLIDITRDEHLHYSLQEEGVYNIRSNRIMSLCHDNGDNLWIGTQENGLLYKNADRKSIENIGNLSTQTIWDIDITQNNQLLLCTRESGVIIYDLKTAQYSSHEAFLEHSYRVAIQGNKEGAYFIGTDDGRLMTFNIDKLSLDYKDISTDFGGIKSLFLDQDFLWIGTQKNGLYVYNLTDEKLIQIDESKGLPNNVVYSILEEGEETVWISTNHGVCELSKKAVYGDSSNVVLQHLTIDNGLICNEFNTGAYSKDDVGNAYFGGIDGVVWFNPRSIRKDLQPVEILLLELITTENKLKINNCLLYTSDAADE